MNISDLVLKKKSSEILTALDRESTHVRGLQEKVGGSASTIQTRIREMKEKELIEEKRQDNFPFKKIIKLTSLGKKITNILKNFEGIEQKRRIETITFEEEKNKLLWPLLLLFLYGKQGNTKVQKLIFLGKNEMGIDIPYDFIPYNYGPFSKELAKDMAKLTTLGLIDPLEKEYRLTEEGKKLAERMYDGLESKKKQKLKKLKKYSKLSLRRLMNLVYTKYPDESGNPNL